ncbi:hypothetical protein TRFO_41009 [Tritrichomonas foetus]|uniref:Uncharacterized protein n=1 Tax=Tritrichomonas foetus TaxID=1144522 RepID=A0A1J4IZS6_9EUKA|nr:hypothetical protein TRFO_41009 [Tritrichomonas foetus]|eukprot:OHS92682.1 hypothetical protein TRFO_41009 [Tritrichomonas foetus]
MSAKLSKTRDFQRDALLGRELKFFEEQSIIDKARYKSFRTPQKSMQIAQVQESVENLTQEINSIEMEMDDDEYATYRQTKRLSSYYSPRKPISEPLEFTLLRSSIAAALSSSDEYDEEEEEEEEEFNEDAQTTELEIENSEIIIGPIDKINDHIQNDLNMPSENSQNDKNESIKENKKVDTSCDMNYSINSNKNQSLSFSQSSPQRNRSFSKSSMKYEELCSFVEPQSQSKYPLEMERAIQASEKARKILESPYMTKSRRIRAAPPTSPSISFYRSQLSSNSSNLNTHRFAKSPSPKKELMEINGVSDHLRRMRRIHLIESPPNIEEDRPDVVLPNRPVITPNMHQLSDLYSREIDDIHSEINHSLNEVYDK